MQYPATSLQVIRSKRLKHSNPPLGVRFGSRHWRRHAGSWANSAICVQNFDDSLNSAIHITYRISLRSSSLREPRYPLLRVVMIWFCAAFAALDQKCTVKRVNKKTEQFTGLVLDSVSYTHLRAHETLRYLVCRLLLEKKKHLICAQ